jgi:hypothetical protein
VSAIGTAPSVGDGDKPPPGDLLGVGPGASLVPAPTLREPGLGLNEASLLELRLLARTASGEPEAWRLVGAVLGDLPPSAFLASTAR